MTSDTGSTVDELLEQLEERWIASDVAVLRHLEPGLSHQAIDEATEPLRLRLPGEARAWWSRHNGARRLDASHSSELLLGPNGLEWLTLNNAIALYRTQREVAERVATSPFDGDPRGDPDVWWHHQWFPLAANGNGGVMACDCSVRSEDPSPIRYVHWSDNEDSGRPVASSLADVLTWWVEAIDLRIWRYESQSQRWLADSTPPQRRSPLTRFL